MFNQETKKFVAMHCNDIADIIEVHDGVPRTFTRDQARRDVFVEVETHYGSRTAEAVTNGHHDCVILLDKINDLLGERDDLRDRLRCVRKLFDEAVECIKPFPLWKAVMAGFIGGLFASGVACLIASLLLLGGGILK